MENNSISKQAKLGKLESCFSTYLKLLPNIRKWDRFIENVSWKMTHFLENIIAETNRVYVLSLLIKHGGTVSKKKKVTDSNEKV